MSRITLFRPAALNARHINWLGEIVLVRPLTFTAMTAFALITGAMVVGFLCWGTYTKRVSVTGQLTPDSGLVKVYTTQPGIVLDKRVSEGQQVRRGQVLYVVSSERHNSDGAVQANVSTSVARRRQSLQEEAHKTRLLQREEQQALRNKIDGLVLEIAKLSIQVEGQASRVKLAQDSVARYAGLSAKDYISKEQLQEKTAEMLDQTSRLQTQERDYLALTRELTIQKNDMDSLALRQQNQLAQIDRSIAGAEQELTESEAKRHLVIEAPSDGTATAVTAEIGQTVDAGKPLLNLVPSGAAMQAHLYAPSSAIGFIKPGNNVLLRYQAFPYQKFGHARGTVLSVSKTALPASELGNTVTATGQSIYRITVRLAAQTHQAYGQPQPLQAGMLLDADIMQETRRLYEWVLEPLYSLSGKL